MVKKKMHRAARIFANLFLPLYIGLDREEPWQETQFLGICTGERKNIDILQR
jgi:hypothetical protein